MKKFLIIAIIFTSLVSFVSCGNKSSTAEPTSTEVAKTEEAHTDEQENPNMAVLSDEQIKSVGIELGAIEEKQLTAALKTNGVLKVPNQNKANVNSIYSGVIKSLLVQPGNIVRKGQTIATIANPEFIQAANAAPFPVHAR